jgi:hypothetical protein
MADGADHQPHARKEALIDELLRLASEEVLCAAEQALARDDGRGLEELLGVIGQSFADHARYASLLLVRRRDTAAGRRIRSAIDELTRRAAAAGTVRQDVTSSDIMALVWAMRGLVQAAGDAAPAAWPRFLAIHLAGLRRPDGS